MTSRSEVLLRRGWFPAGLLIAVGIAAAVGSERFWYGAGLYTAVNAMGVAYTAHLDRSDPNPTPDAKHRGRKMLDIARGGFVLQLPVGILAVMLEGL